MTKQKSAATVNQGGAGKPDQGQPDEFDGIVGNVGESGERPSPGDRDRGETSGADQSGGAADAGTARDRAG